MPLSDPLPDLRKHSGTEPPTSMSGGAVTWRRRCTGTTNCVEVAVAGPSVLVRGSTDPDVWLTLPAATWAGFVAAVKAGGFDA